MIFDGGGPGCAPHSTALLMPRSVRWRGRQARGRILAGKLAMPAGRFEFGQCVYDSKLLWRANLYIDDGAQDWNNTHPWNAPPGDPSNPNNVPVGGVPSWWSAAWGYNEWNRQDPGTAYVQDFTKLPAGDGRQVVTFAPWTRYNGDLSGDTGSDAYKADWFHADIPAVVSEAVAYNSGSPDSPFEFNRKLYEQRYYAQAQSTTADPPAGVAGARTEWRNYKPNDSTYSRIDVGGGNAELMALKNSAPTRTINGVTATVYPYRPTYAAVEMFQFHTYNSSSHQFVSTGIDCNDFVCRASVYAGNPYVMNQHLTDHGITWPGQEAGVLQPIADLQSTYTWEIMTNTKGLDQLKDFTLPQAVSHLVPGDIITMRDPGPPVEWAHVAIVQNIGDMDGDGLISTKEITLIESASGWGSKDVTDGRVINPKSFYRNYRVISGEWYASYLNNSSAPWTYHVGRLKTSP